MSARAFAGKTWNKPYHGPTSAGVSAGGYSAPHVLSPSQFRNSGAQVRERLSIGNLRISVTGHGARFSVGGAGFRFSSSGRVTHRTTIKD